MPTPPTTTEPEPSPARATSGGGTPVIEAVGLGKSIDDRPILRGIDIAVCPGAWLALLGANGAGKSTLLGILATLTTHTAGDLHLFGQPAKRAATIRARIGMIGHQAMLYRDLAARENLVFFGRLYGVRDAGARADELLEMVGLSRRADDPVRQFSRGMLQRVAIARALMHRPELLLADEPFSGLDIASTRQLETLLRQLHAEGMTILLTNHDIAQTLELAQRVVVLRRGQVAIDCPTSETDSAAVTEEVAAG